MSEPRSESGLWKAGSVGLLPSPSSCQPGCHGDSDLRQGHLLSQGPPPRLLSVALKAPYIQLQSPCLSSLISYLFIYFLKYLLIIYVPGSVLGTEDTAENRTDQSSARLGGTDSNKLTNKCVMSGKESDLKQNNKENPGFPPRDL